MRGKDGDPGVMETECAVVINERREEEGSNCGWKDEGGVGMSPQWILYSTFCFTDVKICRATFTATTETFRFISAQKCSRFSLSESFRKKSQIPLQVSVKR